MPLILRSAGVGAFSEKNYLTKRTTFIQLYNNSGPAPDLNILFLFTGDWTQVCQSVFGSTENIRTKMVFWLGQRAAQGDTDRSTSSFSEDEGDTGMSSSSSSEHLAVDRDEHLQLCDPVLCPLPFPSFLCFTRRFWNQIFTCFSDKFRYVAISMRLSLERYMFEVNSRSSSKSCVLVKAVRMRLLLWSLLLLFSASGNIK